ncbi:MAG TPA: ribosome silencing factor [Acidimicrobiales bacterium]|nr:ribosome silencing factor [Acidimicrobiales bacterium]
MAAVESRATLDHVREATGVAARAAWSKGGADTVILAVGEVLAITDAFVITSGTNSRMVRTIAEEVEKKVKEASSRSPRAIEGLDDARWVLMDYGDFVVHVFIDEARDFYQFDRLWADAGRWDWDPEQSGALASGE